MKRINRFFWWCAGANTEILKECPTDHAKYFGIGGTILFTALMASFAGGYAFFTAFKSTIPSVFFGAFWGLLIFNLDRYIVATIGKGDGTQKITLEEWKIAAPRLLLAILLGFVISTPLELKIFETEIQTYVERLKIDKAEELKGRDSTFVNSLNSKKERRVDIERKIEALSRDKSTLSTDAASFLEKEIAEQKKDLVNKNKELEILQGKVNTAYSQYINAQRDSLELSVINQRLNILQKNQSSRNQARAEVKQIQNKIENLNNDRGNAINAEMDRLNGLLSNYQQQSVDLDSEIKNLEQIANQKNISRDNVIKNYTGFAAHLEALGELTKEKPAIFWAKWLITLMFIFIEVAPVLFKLMSEAGPYDDMIDRLKHETSVLENQKISELDDHIQTSIKISTTKNKNRLDAEIAGNNALLQKIALAQAEIAELAIEKWKEEEIIKLKEGVGHIIKSSQSTI